MAQTNNYEAIRQELDSGGVKQELWMRAYAQARGSHSKAVSIYIALRADELYKENTSIYRRTGDSILQMLDLRTRRGQMLVAGIVLTSALLSLLIVQPFLRNSAYRKYRNMYEKARTAAIIGHNQVFLFQQLGQPKGTETTGSSLTYVFNPSPALCFKKSDFEFRVFVDTESGLVTGFRSSTFFEQPQF